MNLKPQKHPQGKGFILKFRHPLLKSVVSRGLGTSDETAAQSIVIDLESLFSKPDLLQGPPYKAELVMYERRAVEIALGAEAARIIFDGIETRPALTVDEIARLVQAGTVLNTPAVDYSLRRRQMIADIDAEQPQPVDAAVLHSERQIAQQQTERVEALIGFTPQANRRLQEHNSDLLKELKVARNELESRRAENDRLRRQHNVDVKATLGHAVESWKPSYRQGRKSDTVKTSFAYLDKFIEFMPEKARTKLGSIRARDIDRWIESLRKIVEVDGNIEVDDEDKCTEFSPLTKRNHRNAVSTFFRWAVSKFDLVENPVAKTLPIAGVESIPERIVAVDRAVDFTSMLSALEPYSYWRTWVAVACFAGPRFQEQRTLRLDDVYVDTDGDLIRVRTRASGRQTIGTKTGRERRIPIERTTLKPILLAFLEERRRQQRATSATAAEKSDWLFPTLAPDGTIPRVKTEVGLWSDNTLFLKWWRRIAQAAGNNQAGKYWEYGPREWRHTFGTILGNCGWNALEIARAMGNSADVCQRHYVASVSAGQDRRWPFKW